MKKPTSKTGESQSIQKRHDDALAVLRTETALSRFPMHRLTKGHNIQIELKNQASAVLWRVSHNSEYGLPGAQAYKLDTLFINRLIEAAGRPVPKIIRLGSLREIGQEIDLGSNTNAVKQALLQNATATITAKINYRTQDGGEQWLEAVFSRYSVVFTGETLPGANGATADAVYLVLNDIYQQILNTSVFRPLDYDYMKALPPFAQRFYEIVSYQIYAATRHGNPRAKVAYSEYCLLSTATRYLDFDHVKKQMYKVLKPHLDSGYIAKIEYESAIDEQGQPDWMMMLTPGVNAHREYRAFTGTGQTRKPGKSKAKSDELTLPFPEIQPSTSDPAISPSEVVTSSTDTEASRNTEPTDLVEELVAAQLNRSDAERWAAERPEVCRRQLEFLPFVEKFKSSQGAYLRRAIEEDYGPPAAYAQAQAQQEAKTRHRQRQAQQMAQAAEEKARQGHENRFRAAFVTFLGERVEELEKTHPEAFQAFSEWEAQQRSNLVNSPLADRPLFQETIAAFDTAERRGERLLDFCREHQKQFALEVPSFWKWDEAVNPEPFRP